MPHPGSSIVTTHFIAFEKVNGATLMIQQIDGPHNAENISDTIKKVLL